MKTRLCQKDIDTAIVVAEGMIKHRGALGPEASNFLSIAAALLDEHDRANEAEDVAKQYMQQAFCLSLDIVEFKSKCTKLQKEIIDGK